MTDPVILFPERIPIGSAKVGKDSAPVYATREFLRALQALVARVGGEASDGEIDMFSNAFGAMVLNILAQQSVRKPEQHIEPTTYNDLKQRVQLLEGYVSELIARQ